MRKALFFVLWLALLVWAVPSWTEERPFPTEKKHLPRLSGFFDFFQLPPSPGVGRVTTNECTISTATQPAIYAGNFLADCDGEVPHNETTMVVNPNNPAHGVGGYHSYQLHFRGATSIQHVVSTASVSFDHGDSWHEVTPPIRPYQFSGDPALAFDARERLYYSSIADHEGPGGPFTAPSVIVTRSDDGGLNWTTPVTVARGHGAETPGTSSKLFNDKQFIAADWFSSSPHSNRAYISWSAFQTDLHGSTQFFRVPIRLSFSDDGVNWSAPQEISGFSPACVATISGVPNECDLNQDSYPAAAPNGRVYVSFENFNTVAENQAMIVSSDDGGLTWTNPVRIDTLFDINFPTNTDGRDTLTGCNFRYSVKANTATDPSDATGSTVYVVWADNRNGSETATNTDVFLARSTDGGATWTVHNIDSRPNDQFYAWVAVGLDGTVNVGYMDRAYSAGQSVCEYGFTLARVTFAGGTPTVALQRVDTGLSDPGHSRWFSTATNPSSRFLGDYNAVAVGSDGAAWSLWTDHRALFPNPPSPLRNHAQHAVGDVAP